MKKQQSGFTLIELVVVIVILGILAATALPKFIDLKADALSSALAGVAGSYGAAHAVNYAGRKVNSTYGVTMTDCSLSTVLQGGLPSGYSVTAGAIVTNSTATCTVTQTNGGATATFVGLGIT